MSRVSYIIRGMVATNIIFRTFQGMFFCFQNDLAGFLSLETAKIYLRNYNYCCES